MVLSVEKAGSRTKTPFIFVSLLLPNCLLPVSVPLFEVNGNDPTQQSQCEARE